MIRTLLYLIFAVLTISFLRGVIGFLARLVSNATVNPRSRAGNGPGTPRPEALKTEALKKDPVCGTFVAPSTSVRKEKNGQTYYFCSAACRDKF